MNKNRFLFTLPLLLLSAPLTACGGGSGDDDSNPGTGGGGNVTASKWAGHTYLLSVPDEYWSSPRGIGDEIGPFVPSFLFKMEAMGSDLKTTIGFAAPGSTAASVMQDLCSPTSVVTVSGAAYPNSQIGPVNTRAHVNHVNTMKGITVDLLGTVYNLSFTNVLPGDAPADSGTMSATMDFREIAPVFTALDMPSPDTVCKALSDSYGHDKDGNLIPEGNCGACPNDQGLYCMTMKGGLLGAVEVGIDVKAVDEKTISPDCVKTTMTTPTN